MFYRFILAMPYLISLTEVWIITHNKFYNFEIQILILEMSMAEHSEHNYFNFKNCRLIYVETLANFILQKKKFLHYDNGPNPGNNLIF